MTLRGQILGELHRRLVAAFPKAVAVAVAAAVEIKTQPGDVVLAILPGEDQPWDDSEYPSDIYREWGIVVQVGRARGRDETKDTLVAWQSLEDVLDKVIAAVEEPATPDNVLAGIVKALDRLSIEPSEQPVGGVAVGLDVTWRLRYAAVPA